MRNIDPNNPAEHTADSILAAFEDALAISSDTTDLLNAWTRRFPAMGPDFALALTDHAAGLPVVSSPPDSARLEDLAAAAVSAYVIPGELRDAEAQPKVSARTLKDCARNVGLSFPAQLAAQMRVPSALLERLSRREIEPATIPRPFVSDLAAALQLSLADCGRILRGTAGFAAAVQEARTPYGHAISFDEALTSDGSEEDRAYWSARAAFGAALGNAGSPPQPRPEGV